jgi:ligand-binding sensor domain-containing protein
VDWRGEGLVRFDGLHFNLIDSASPEQPSLTHVLGLLGDTDGSLWLRLRWPGQTLLRYENGGFHDAMGELATHASLSAMNLGRNGSPEFCLLEGKESVVIVRNRSFEQIAKAVGILISSVAAIAHTSNGDLWLGTADAGLFRVRGGETIRIAEGLPDLKVNALVPANDGGLWVATDHGIVRWDGAKLTKYRRWR